MIDDFKTDNEKIDSQTFTVTVQIPAANVWAMLTSAFEGGSNYWIREVAVLGDPGKWKYLQDVPFVGGSIRVHCDDQPHEDLTDEEGVCHRLLTMETLSNGLLVMQKHFSRHFANFINDCGDAETGDVFLQCCLFDDVIYG